MTGLLLSYLLYNVLAGIVLTLYYYVKEGERQHSDVFWWLLLFPAVGLGKKHYTTATGILPEKWYVYKYMVQVHWGYIIAWLVGPVLFAVIAGSLFGNLASDTGHAGNAGELLVDMLATAGLMLLGALATLFLMVAMLVLFLVMIVWPRQKMKQIELEVYKSAYVPQPVAYHSLEDKRRFLLRFDKLLEQQYGKCYFKLSNGVEYQGWISDITDTTFRFYDSGPMAREEHYVLNIADMDTTSFAYWDDEKKQWVVFC